MNPDLPNKLMPRLRRLFARTGLEPEEVNILRGILKALSRSPPN
jgi:tRNA/rRNA methyltransferase